MQGFLEALENRGLRPLLQDELRLLSGIMKQMTQLCL
jgi:hypothetical protein